MNTQQYQPVKINMLGSVLGRPIGLPPQQYGAMPILAVNEPPPLEMPGQGLSRAINYYADYAGCGWWRMIAPEMLMNISNKAVICGLTTMVLDPRFYSGIKAVRLQRQATPVQLQFLKFLKQGSAQHNFKIIYEIDDIIVKHDIPDYNRCKVAFESDEIMNSCIEMMQMSDEISVTCQYMKDYYINKTGNKKVTVIPNYPAKMWLDGHYDPKKIIKDYQNNKKKPRIAYVGSGTHIDVMNKTNQKDDFAHVVDDIISSRKDIQWVFVGAFPLACKPFIDRGEMEFVQWFPLLELWKAYTTTDIQAVIAPLQSNAFNMAKSNIKFLEAATAGIPGCFQRMVTYKDAPLLFDTGSELIDQIKFLTKNEDTYMKYSKKAREYSDTMWLDDHLDEFCELYYTNIGDANRIALLKNNPDQKVTK
jgi:glycosyltransferase involved in cell wall biosynthesis